MSTVTLARRPVVDLPDQALLTSDGVRLSARHDPRHNRPDDRGLGFVVAHGFTGSWRRPDLRGVVDGLAAQGGVVCFDFRGHGGSAGRSTVGDLEVEDLQAAVRWARELGYTRLVTVGWSMGAAVAIRQAALHGAVDAVVAVSGPSRWHYRGTAAMRLVHRAIESRSGRLVAARVYGTRIAATGWTPPPEPPDAVVGRIAPTPLLLVHGDADHFFPLEHARWLAAAAGGTAQLWVEAGFGHAESAATPELVGRIAAWARQAVGPGTGPPDGDGRPAGDPAEVGSGSARMPG
jgi:pimeloyl-ACP methyl ester carboxylesterase